jgi:DNA polymerase III delta subunit
MPILSPVAARAQIASGDLAPIYLVLGADEVLKAEIVSAFVETIDTDLRAFNVERLYAGDPQAAENFVDAARTLPMMATRRIVLLLQAEKLFVPRRESEAADDDLELIESYVAAPEPLTTAVFVATALDKRRTLTRRLREAATLIDCSGIIDRADADGWIRAKVGQEGMRIEPAAIRMLADRATVRLAAPERGVAIDLARLRVETDRACLYAAAGSTVTLGDVKEIIGPETLQDEWGVVRQLEQGSAAGALRELSLVFAAGGVPYMILGQLRSYVERSCPPDRRRAAVDALFRTDIALKSSAGNPRVLLERLVVELAGRAGSRGPGPGRRPR